jgi:hypothetical protein
VSAECLPQVHDRPTVGSTELTWLLVGLFSLLLVVHLPIFLCLPPDNDVVVYDVCVREVFAQRAFYRDVFENNFPGMLWVQSAIRKLWGWKVESLRLADLAFVAVSLLLLSRWLPDDASSTARMGLILVLSAFYLGTSEWCHAQRDVWMMLPVLIALNYRCNQVEGADSFTLAAIEGVFWGAAVWLKPFVIVPAITCWVASLLLRRRGWRRFFCDLGGLLFGGLIIGIAGLLWLIATGAWVDFWDIQLVWNREYVTHDYSDGERWHFWLGVCVRFFPWMFAHLAAMPVALGWLYWRYSYRRALLAALYLGWLAQVVFLQHGWDYTQVTPLFLALTILGIELARSTDGRRTAIAIFLALCVLVRMGPLTAQRWPHWTACLNQGSTPRLKDQLGQLNKVHWESLGEVCEYLLNQQVKDGELTCMSMSSIALYLELNVRPATRYLALQNILVAFRSHRERVGEELANSAQRFMIVDTTWVVWKDKVVPPVDVRVVFQSGPYRVYAMTGRELASWVKEHLELTEE